MAETVTSTDRKTGYLLGGTNEVRQRPVRFKRRLFGRGRNVQEAGCPVQDNHSYPLPIYTLAVIGFGNQMITMAWAVDTNVGEEFDVIVCQKASDGRRMSILLFSH